MEILNLQQLSLILDQDLVILKEEVHATMTDVKEQIDLDVLPPDNNSLVQDSPAAYKGEDQSDVLIYEGNFQKKILIVFQGKTLQNDYREFILKLLNAVHCSLDDVALVSSVQFLQASPNAINQLKPSKLLIFGKLDHPIMQHKISNYQTSGDKAHYFFADTLEDLEESVPLKRKLWNGLKVLFQL